MPQGIEFNSRYFRQILKGADAIILCDRLDTIGNPNPSTVTHLNFARKAIEKEDGRHALELAQRGAYMDVLVTMLKKNL